MPLPRFRLRFTVRRLMVAVAIFALLAWAGVEGEKRRARFHDLFMQYTLKEMGYSVFAYSGPGGEHLRKRKEAFAARKAKYYPFFSEMARKYRRAERLPWLPVWPDPPEPK